MAEGVGAAREGAPGKKHHRGKRVVAEHRGERLAQVSGLRFRQQRGREGERIERREHLLRHAAGLFLPLLLTHKKIFV